MSEVTREGLVSLDWFAVIIRASIPLAILAGCQTLAMLTGGIDLSVGAVASMSGFVVATLVNGPGLPAGIVIALADRRPRRASSPASGSASSGSTR